MRVIMKPLLLLLAIIVLSTCVDPVRPEFRFRDGFLVINGEISNLPNESRLTIQVSTLNQSTYDLVPFQPLSVVTIDGSGNSVPWAQVGSTEVFLPPADFRGIAGETYFLQVETESGQFVESDPEIMPEVVPIASLRMQFEQEAYFSDELERFVPAFRFLVDFSDPPATRNFYRWQVNSWERRFICLSCNFAQVVDYATGECVSTNRSRFVPRFDYLCADPCWEIMYDPNFNVFSDEFVDGNQLNAFEAGRIPYDWYGGLLVNVRQQQITAAAYEYNQNLSDLSQSSGGLNATLPAALDGNLNAVVEGGQTVLGYFGVAATSSDRIYFDRDTISGTALSFDARWNLDVPPPPAVQYFDPCDGPNRTTIRPEGWPE